MKTEQLHGSGEAFEVLRGFARKPERNVERCELCSAEVVTNHPHLVEIGQHRLFCACDACALLFSGRADAKYKRVPRRVRLILDFKMTDAEWEGLLIPIDLAFFFRNSIDSRVSALYPSPAGATESMLSLEAWNDIESSNPALREVEDDVEALLVNRVGHAREARSAQYYVVPIDACYKLVGLIRLHWRGLSGGTEVWQEISKFFAGLNAAAEIVTQELHA